MNALYSASPKTNAKDNVSVPTSDTLSEVGDSLVVLVKNICIKVRTCVEEM